jgi:hypothetical protein
VVIIDMLRVSFRFVQAIGAAAGESRYIKTQLEPDMATGSLHA